MRIHRHILYVFAVFIIGAKRCPSVCRLFHVSYMRRTQCAYSIYSIHRVVYSSHGSDMGNSPVFRHTPKTGALMCFPNAPTKTTGADLFFSCRGCFFKGSHAARSVARAGLQGTGACLFSCASGLRLGSSEFRQKLGSPVFGKGGCFRSSNASKTL